MQKKQVSDIIKQHPVIGFNGVLTALENYKTTVVDNQHDLVRVAIKQSYVIAKQLHYYRNGDLSASEREILMFNGKLMEYTEDAVTCIEPAIVFGVAEANLLTQRDKENLVDELGLVFKYDESPNQLLGGLIHLLRGYVEEYTYSVSEEAERCLKIDFTQEFATLVAKITRAENKDMVPISINEYPYNELEIIDVESEEYEDIPPEAQKEMRTKVKKVDVEFLGAGDEKAITENIYNLISRASGTVDDTNNHIICLREGYRGIESKLSWLNRLVYCTTHLTHLEILCGEKDIQDFRERKREVFNTVKAKLKAHTGLIQEVNQIIEAK